MKNLIVEVPSIKSPIQASPGFHKKELSEYKLDILGLCGFGCRYCSSNEGNYLRIHRGPFAERTLLQLGRRLTPADTPELMFTWPDVLERLDAQLSSSPPAWGRGKTLVFSMLTDGFSPELVRRGITEAALRMVLKRTQFRIRVLTKNSIVGSTEWIQFFREHPGRFVVGLSTGTGDDIWARRIEVGTSLPSARLRALHRLQDAGVPTFGMLCPVFPDLLEGESLDRLVAQIRPELVEHVWAEPYNDRNNWSTVRHGYEPGSFGFNWLTEVYHHGRKSMWSHYATDLYVRLLRAAESGEWLTKLRYLLYEGDIVEDDAIRLGAMQGILLQSAPSEDGCSRNPFIAQQQRIALFGSGRSRPRFAS